jgi:hypothetical protein
MRLPKEKAAPISKVDSLLYAAAGVTKELPRLLLIIAVWAGCFAVTDSAHQCIGTHGFPVQSSRAEYTSRLRQITWALWGPGFQNLGIYDKTVQTGRLASACWREPSSKEKRNENTTVHTAWTGPGDDEPGAEHAVCAHCRRGISSASQTFP